MGLCAVLAAGRLGFERVIAMSRHADRAQVARDFGATDTVAERGDEGVARVEEPLTATLEGSIDPGRGVRPGAPLAQVADAYAAMDERRSIKTLLRP